MPRRNWPQGQPEVYAIQNRSPLYATPEWDRTRIAVLQEAFLRERIETDRLRGEIRAAGERARSVGPVDVVPIRGSGELIKADWQVVTGAARTAFGPIREAVRFVGGAAALVGPRGMRPLVAAWRCRHSASRARARTWHVGGAMT